MIELLPPPVDIPPVQGTDEREQPVLRKADDTEKFSALAFKLMTDPFVGQLTFIRVYSGVLLSGATVLNSVKDRKERIGRILQMHANNREEIKEILAGDIAACVGLKDVTTGETLCDPDSPIILERMVFPDPVIHVAVEPKTKSDQEKMGIALGRLAAEDPSFRVRTDEESGQTIISGMGELHLEIIVDRMKREFNVEANVGAPQVAYREAVRKSVEQEGKFVKQSGGRGQFGHVWIKLEPNEPGKGYEFIDAIKGGVVPREFIPAVDKGLRETLPNGVLGGFPVVDVKVTLFDGSYHDVDSDENAFKMAASMAFKDAMRKASPVLLEPMMAVVVETPEDDGTTNFLHSVPYFSVSVALADGPDIIAGIVHEVMHNEVFIANTGSGAFLNGKPIHVSPRVELRDILVGTGFPYNTSHVSDGHFAALRKVLMTTRGIRRIGSAALDLCYVACGRFGAFYEHTLNPWDIAAGALIVREAGGLVSDYGGEDQWLSKGEILATAPQFLPEMLEICSEFYGPAKS